MSQTHWTTKITFCSEQKRKQQTMKAGQHY